jgi:co-chaperonin GroES (HSP10)
MNRAPVARSSRSSSGCAARREGFTVGNSRNACASRSRFACASSGNRSRDARAAPSSPVLFAKYSGTEVKIDGDDHLILREDDILGVIVKS